MLVGYFRGCALWFTYRGVEVVALHEFGEFLGDVGGWRVCCEF